MTTHHTTHPHALSTPTSEVTMHHGTRCSTPSLVSPLRPTKIRRRVLTTKTLFHGLANELLLLGPTYARLRLAHPVLAEYPTLESLLTRLTEGPRDDVGKHLVAALIAIRQSTPHRLWVAILLRTFRPMLGKIGKELYGTDPQEKLAILLTAFQAALLHVDARRDPLRIGMYVRQATRRRAFISLTKEIRWSDIGFGEDADTTPDTRSPGSSIAERRRIAEGLQSHGALLSLVRREYPSASVAEQLRRYHKLRRRLKQALLELGEHEVADQGAAR
jgi:hypothetical protein